MEGKNYFLRKNPGLVSIFLKKNLIKLTLLNGKEHKITKHTVEQVFHGMLLMYY